MRTEIIQETCRLMKNHLSPEQNRILENTLHRTFQNFDVYRTSEPSVSPSSVSA